MRMASQSSRGPDRTFPINVPSFQAVTAALTNPYAQYATASPHYAQALAQHVSQSWHGRPATTAEGYTLSSTYAPGTTRGPARGAGSPLQTDGSRPSQPARPRSAPSSWYQPGNCRCTYQRCAFTGSQKSLEIHMADRHLIYPPGWEHRKRDDWDADISLKGKSVPIHGTSIVLDDPEILAKWIAERKKRYPTQQRTEEKKRKLDDAAKRGQLSPEDMGLRQKRRRVDDDRPNAMPPQRGHRRGRGRGAYRGRQRPPSGRTSGDGRAMTLEEDVAVSRKLEPSPRPLPATQAVSTTDSGSDDDSPEIASSKPQVTQTPDPSQPPQINLDGGGVPSPVPKVDHQADRSSARATRRQPQKSPQNPFKPRANLLRNLLLPEIRSTVSNLSQAIRFLFNNNFLEGVELVPGQALEKRVEILQVPTKDIVSSRDTSSLQEG